MPRTLPMQNVLRARQRESMAEIRAALEIILGAAANLRHYHGRLTPAEHYESVRDIECAAEQLSTQMEAMCATLPKSARKRRPL